jgi:hypothetical protein
MTFQPGQSGNPAGRPRGSRNKRTILAEALLDDRAGELTGAVIDLATRGNAAALRVCMDRLTPPLRHRLLDFELPDIATAADAVVAGNAIMQGAARGELTVPEAAGLMKMVRDLVRVMAAADLEKRVARLEAENAEKARGGSDANYEGDDEPLDLGDLTPGQPPMGKDNPVAIAAADHGLPDVPARPIRDHGKDSGDRDITPIGFVLQNSENGCAILPISRASCTVRSWPRGPAMAGEASDHVRALRVSAGSASASRDRPCNISRESEERSLRLM